MQFVAFLLAFTIALSPALLPGRQDLQPVDLPEGDGKQILLRACTTCHTLKEVTKFKGYYGREEWRDVIETMVAYGAKLDDSQTTALLDYLSKHFGPAPNVAPQ
jgi:mono/diheme cytochrome c family protein